MTGMRLVSLVVLLATAGGFVATAASVDAQVPMRRLVYVRDTAFALDAGTRGQVAILVARDGRIVVSPNYFYSELSQLDSSGKKLPWAVKLGRGRDAEIGWVNAWGWRGDSVWVGDPLYEQVALIGSDGKIARSIAYPSWIRPSWSDRRRYPLFSRMTWYAMYGDGTLLVQPGAPRRLFDTPGYDPDRNLLLRVDRDGRILRTIATTPIMEGRLQLRSGTERRMVIVPFYPRVVWKAGDDGQRVAVVAPVASDSGAFMITALSDQGDTVFSRRYAVAAWRVVRATADSFLTRVQAFGRYSVQQVRDTIAKQMPAFYSPVQGVSIGLDHSTWVSIRRPGVAASGAAATEWFVVDSAGEPIGIASFPKTLRPSAVSLDRLWAVEIDRVKQRSAIVRYRRTDARGAPPARTARASASASPARPRE